MTIGDRMRQLRQQRNMTQEQLGRLLGVGQSTVAHYESQKCTCSINTER